MKPQVNLNSTKQRRALGMRLLDRIRRSQDGITYYYAPLNGLSVHQVDQGFKETGTLRKCTVCQAPATRQRLTQTARGVDRSSRAFVCSACE